MIPLKIKSTLRAQKRVLEIIGTQYVSVFLFSIAISIYPAVCLHSTVGLNFRLSLQSPTVYLTIVWYYFTLVPQLNSV